MPFAELDDATLYYKTRGEGPPVIGIMGFGLDQRFWAGQIPTVTAANTFVTFDNRGTGLSRGTRAPTITTMAADTTSLMDHLGYHTAVIMGVSMGGAIAQRVALEHPDRVAGLVLAMTWARPLEFMRRQNTIARILVNAGGPDALVQATILRMFTPRFFEIGRDTVDGMTRAVTSPPGPTAAPTAVLDAQLDAIEHHDVLTQLPRIRCPTLVVGGRMDMIVPFFASEEIAGAIPGADLVAFETGHGLMVEEMEGFNAALRRFLQTVNADSSRIEPNRS
jgi:pimeloyl-ACP methyl ester carboxylesterase